MGDELNSKAICGSLKLFTRDCWIILVYKLLLFLDGITILD